MGNPKTKITLKYEKAFWIFLFFLNFSRGICHIDIEIVMNIVVQIIAYP